MNPRTLRLIAVPVLLVALLASSCADGGGGPAPAATVGTSDITNDELAAEAQLYTFLAGLQQQPCGGPAPEGESQEAVCNRFALGNLVLLRLVEDYAEANGVTVTDQEVDRIVAELDAQLTKEVVDEELAKLGLTRADLDELARQVLLIRAVSEAVTAEGLDDAALRAMYDEQILRFTTVEPLHILVRSEAEARRVHEEVTAPGADRSTFEELASEVSTDRVSAKEGGSLGQAVASTYVPAFGEAVAALEPGEISEPVQTDFGWHVIYLVDKQVASFEEARPQLVGGQQADVFDTWIREQVDQQGVEVNPRYGRYDPNTLTVVALTGTDPSAGPADGAPNDGDEGTPAP